MPKILGVNKGQTSYGKPLWDGGAAVAVDDQVRIAIAEERLTRHKRAGGFAEALDVVLKDQGLSLDDMDLIVASTCCEHQLEAAKGHVIAGHPRLITVDHHLAHAYQAYYESGFRRALVVVIDGGGNTCGEGDPTHWWTLQRDQHSYYLAEGDRIELVDRDFFEPYATGFGEVYRAFTYYLGFGSSQYASRVMALAGLGNGKRALAEPPVFFEGGRLLGRMKNDPRAPMLMVSRLGEEIGANFWEPRQNNEEIRRIHADIAAYVQTSVEDALLAKLKWLKRQYPVECLCMSGGFALNCVANGRVVKGGLFQDMYVPSAPGDSGQCVGNAIFGSMKVRKMRKQQIGGFTCQSSEDVARGPTYSTGREQLLGDLHRLGHSEYVVFEPVDLPRTVAHLLSKGCLVAICNARSETGPRALGNRSILCDPRDINGRARCNELKKRSWLMPFAPTVLQDSVDHLFEHHVRSPFMSFAVPAAESAGYNLRAVLSHDGTARLQTVASSDSSFIARVLVWFHRLTGVPCVLNTSFNRGGEPIVETPYHALETFMESPVNTLVLDSYMIVKSVDRELVDAHLLPESFGMPILMVGVGVDNPIDLRQRTVVQTIRRIGAIGQVVCIRSTLPLFDEYVRLLRKGSKLTTIRYVKGGIELPATEVLPLVGTPDFGKHRAPVDSNVSVRIGQVVYKKFGELDEHDATRDGFQSLAQLKGVLGESIYPGILDNQFVTIYSIQMVGQL